jgi:molybdenum cofactor cytidylyltransferase
MKFGAQPVARAVGAVLAHGVKHHDGVFKKGRVLTIHDIEILQSSGIENVTVAQLEPTDVHEDQASRALALAVSGDGVLAQQAFTGRANVHAKRAGLAMIDAARVREINHLHESLTIATLPTFTHVTEKQMVATVKVIPFATPRDILERALVIAQHNSLLSVQPFQRQHITLIITRLEQTKLSIVSKTEVVMRERLSALGLALHTVVVTDHAQANVAEQIKAAAQKGSDLILVFGASAIVDRADVIPAALVQVGGEVVHLGMPVDPGNLLMMGAIGAIPVIGVPSCARSPKRNGFDWVLERVCAGLEVTREDLMDMGAGGLLAEIPSRPSPRELQVPSAPRVVAVVLAAGRGSRMGQNKMLAPFNNTTMLGATLDNIQAAGVDEVIVVTGHDHEMLASMLWQRNVRVVHNPDYQQGMSSSLAAGVRAAGAIDAVIVCLGDMPRVKAQVLDRMIAAFNPIEHRSIVVPTYKGEFGNPVLWGAEHFQRLTSLQGDKGARALIAGLKAEATEVDVDDEGILRDADTPEELAKLTASS